MTTLPDASFIFEPANDISLMLALYHSRDPEVRDEGLRLADENCRSAGQPVINTHSREKTNADRAR